MDTAMRSQRTAHQIASCPKGTEIYLLFFPHEDGVPEDSIPLMNSLTIALSTIISFYSFSTLPSLSTTYFPGSSIMISIASCFSMT